MEGGHTDSEPETRLISEPRNTTYDLDHASSEAYEHSQVTQNVHHDNAIDIVESDDEHLELKQSTNSKLFQSDKLIQPHVFKTSTANVELLANYSKKARKSNKSKNDNMDDSVPKLQHTPSIARSQLLQDTRTGTPSSTTTIENESRPNIPTFAVDQQVTLFKKQNDGIQNINGIVYNDRGYEICGHMNQHNKPCQRIGNCPFHGQSSRKQETIAEPSKSVL